jgi:ABC-type phosphate/phosphonate transport system substrate-binding protein
MYAASAAVLGSWRALFSRIFRDVGIDVRFIDHGFPQPIDELWRMPGLCCDFMCGWPFVRSEGRMRAIASPVPSPRRYAGLPRYCSEFLVRERSGWTSIEETFGHRVGWMSDDSQSGFNAPRAFLSTFVTTTRTTLFGESRGPYVTPARLLDALHRDEVDVVAVDGFYLDLCRRHAPERLASLRTIAHTPWTALPLLVAGSGVPQTAIEQLRECLLGAGAQAAYASLLDDVLLQGFVLPPLDSYRELETMAALAIDRGYPSIR